MTSFPLIYAFALRLETAQQTKAYIKQITFYDTISRKVGTHEQSQHSAKIKGKSIINPGLSLSLSLYLSQREREPQCPIVLYSPHSLVLDQ